MTADKKPVEEFIKLADQFPLVDVRSPAEYKKGHIPGAINIPLFDDVERTEIGKLYKIKGKEEAVERGLQLVAPKLAEFVQKTKTLSVEKKVLVYCWRGGMRSQSFSWLMNTAGLDSKILQGGYKSYRNFVLSFFSRPVNLVRLGGATGSGKTQLLQRLHQAGEQIIDLEKLARHKGSAFGSINEPRQLPQQQFEHLFFNTLSLVDPRRRCWVEDEAMAIGWNKIPLPFWQQMKRAPLVVINVPPESRIKRLVNDYSTTNPELLKKALVNITKKIGGQNLIAALDFLQRGQLDKVAEIALRYYDDAYHHDILKNKHQKITELNFGDEIFPSDLEKIIQAAKSLE